LVFHSINSLWLLVTFTPVLVVYGLFFDWQAFRERLWPHRVAWLRATPPRFMRIGASLFAILCGLLWDAGMGFSAVFGFGTAFGSRAFWFFVLVLAVIALAKALVALLGRDVQGSAPSSGGRYDP